MDPNATLRAIFESDGRFEAAQLCQALAQWMRNGGFAPTVPADAKYWPGTNTPWSILSPDIGNGKTWQLVRYSPDGTPVERFTLHSHDGTPCAVECDGCDDCARHDGPCSEIHS